MKKKIYISVESETDSLGIETPLRIKWDSNKEYVVERVIHASCENSSILKYIVLVCGQQKTLYKERNRWFVEPNY